MRSPARPSRRRRRRHRPARRGREPEGGVSCGKPSAAGPGPAAAIGGRPRWVDQAREGRRRAIARRSRPGVDVRCGRGAANRVRMAWRRAGCAPRPPRYASRPGERMTERGVKDVVTPEAVSDGAGVRLKRSIATGTLDHLDPFFLFDHFGSENPDDYVAGFPMHPHRGIETVTYMLDGSVAHRDSLGNSGVVGPGDVQWMTAGSGILHEEMPRVGPRRLDGFQIWVNLPRKLKMTTPRYRGVEAADIPVVARPDGSRIRVVAGSVDGVEGAVREIFAGPTYLDVSLPAGGTFAQPVARGYTAMLYVFQGEVAVAGTPGHASSVAATRLVVLDDGDVVHVRAGAGPARFLLLAAQPLEEPYARWGPFVMNTEEEVRQALEELRDGTFIKERPGVESASSGISP